MKPFRTILKLVIKKHLCNFHDYFPVVEYSSNDVMLNLISKHIVLYYFNTIRFEFLYITFFLKIYRVFHNSLQDENFKIVFMTNYCNQTLYIGDIMVKYKTEKKIKPL